MFVLNQICRSTLTIRKVRIEGSGIYAIKFQVPTHVDTRRAKKIPPQNMFSDNTLEEQDDKLFPNKIAMRQRGRQNIKIDYHAEINHCIGTWILLLGRDVYWDGRIAIYNVIYTCRIFFFFFFKCSLSGLFLFTCIHWRTMAFRI